MRKLLKRFLKWLCECDCDREVLEEALRQLEELKKERSGKE